MKQFLLASLYLLMIKNLCFANQNIDNEKKGRETQVLLCIPLPDGSWDCSGKSMGFEDKFFELTQPPSVAKVTSTEMPTSAPIYLPTSAPTPPKQKEQNIQDEGNQEHSYQRSGCNFNWNDEKDCPNIISSENIRVERSLFPGQYICSPNHRYFFGMTLDHNLVICQGRENTIWSEGHFSDIDPYLLLKKNGSLEVQARDYSQTENKKVLWENNAIANKKSTLLLDDKGTLSTITKSEEVIWKIEVEAASVINPFIFSETNQHSESHVYFPGELFVDPNTGLKLSIGLQARLIAKTGLHVPYTNKTNSFIPFHDQPDAGGCFSASDGGWYYMSNSEAGNDKDANGGVGRIKFNVHGDIEEYKMVLSDTRMNCGSGVTPWNTYISCEEYEGEFGNKKKRPGQCWEVHPSELWLPRPTAMGGVEGGRFESAAFDARNMTQLKGFVTTDHKMGALYRFTPDPDILKMAMVSGDYSEVLHHPGTIDYLLLDPIMKTFQWTTSKRAGMLSAKENFPNAEGIDVHDGRLYFTTKTNKELFILDLDNFEYSSSITLGGAFNGQPDQIVRLLPEDNDDQFEESLLYFLEDGGQNPAGVFARDPSAKRYLTVLEGGENNSDETTGLAFCDSGRRMMVAFQDEGELYEIIRSDGKPFYGATVDIKYHDV